MVAGGLLLVAGLSGLWGLVRYRVDLPVVPLSLGVGLGLLAYGATARAGAGAPAGDRGRSSDAAGRAADRGCRLRAGDAVLVGGRLRPGERGPGGSPRGRDHLAAARRDRVQRQAAAPRGSHHPETELPGPDAAYRYRYSGLKLVVRSGGKWFLLPASWTPGNRGAALLLSDTDELRVEFTPGR